MFTKVEMLYIIQKHYDREQNRLSKDRSPYILIDINLLM